MSEDHNNEATRPQIVVADLQIGALVYELHDRTPDEIVVVEGQ